MTELDMRTAGTADTTRWGTACLAGALGLVALGLVGAFVPVVPGDPAFAWYAVPRAVGSLLLAAGPVGVWRSGATGRSPLAVAAAGSGVLGAVAVVLGNAVSLGIGRDAAAFYIVGTVLLFAWTLVAGVLALRTRVWVWPWRVTPLVPVLGFAVAAPFAGMPAPAGELSLTGMMLPFVLVGVALLADRRAER